MYIRLTERQLLCGRTVSASPRPRTTKTGHECDDRNICVYVRKKYYRNSYCARTRFPIIKVKTNVRRE